MAENTTIRNEFFNSLAKGAKWDVGVSINRTNPLPLDQYSVFKSETDLDTYIGGAFSYPGQIVALVGESETVIYYLAEKADHTGLEKIEVGSMPGVDGKSIKIAIDENGDEYLTLVGLEGAATGASLIKLADGSIGWSSTTQEGLTADLTGIKSDISELNTVVFGEPDPSLTAEFLAEYIDNGLVDRVEALANKFKSMGGIFNFAGSITVDVENPMPSANLYDVGDVLLVNGKEEWVCIADTENPGNNKWEAFGDPDGITELKGTVTGHTNDITALNAAVAKKAEKDYVDVELGKKVNVTEYAERLDELEDKVSQKIDQVDVVNGYATKSELSTLSTAVGTKAEKTYVDNQISAVNSEVAKKADATETTNALNQKATKDELTNGLALKADKSTTETAINDLGTRLTTAEGDIDKLEATVAQNTIDILSNIGTLRTHGSDIAGLKSDLGSVADVTNSDGSYKTTAFGKAAEAKALAGAAQTQADLGVENAKKAQAAAAAADSKADAAQDRADEAYELADTKVDNDTYTGKVADIEGRLDGHDTAIGLRAETTYVNEQLATKVNNSDYTIKVGQLEEAIGLRAETTYVNEQLAKKADKTATESAISEINAKIGTLGNVMNFIGKLDTDDNGNITTVGEHGDVGYVDNFEYVYIVTGEGETATGKWEKFGDTSAEGGRISALETAVGNLDNSGLVKAVADLQAEDIAIKNTADALSTSVDNRFTIVNETLASLGTNKVDVSAYNEKIAALEAADAKEVKDRDDAVKAEASARAAAISTLDTYYQDALSWGTF